MSSISIIREIYKVTNIGIFVILIQIYRFGYSFYWYQYKHGIGIILIFLYIGMISVNTYYRYQLDLNPTPDIGIGDINSVLVSVCCMFGWLYLYEWIYWYGHIGRMLFAIEKGFGFEIEVFTSHWKWNSIRYMENKVCLQQPFPRGEDQQYLATDRGIGTE